MYRLILICLVFILIGCHIFSPTPNQQNNPMQNTQQEQNNIFQENLKAIPFMKIALSGSILIATLGILLLFMGQAIGTKLAMFGAIGFSVLAGFLRYTNFLAFGGIVLIIFFIGTFIWTRIHVWKETVKSVNTLLDAFPEQREKMIEILKSNQSKTAQILNGQLKVLLKATSNFNKKKHHKN